MSTFGGLFGHDKLSARASGKFQDGTGELPALPGQAPVYGAMSEANPYLRQTQSVPQAPPAAPMDVSGLASDQLVQAPQLPAAPPKRRGAFDDQNYRQTMLQMAAGFFGSQNFGDGMANAAQAIAQGNEHARQADRPVLGGPDDSFEIYTDPETGEHRFVPIQAAHEYLADKRNRVTPKDLLDFNGRYALQLNGITDPAQRATAEQYMADNPSLFPGFNKALIGGDSTTTGLVADNGQTVTQARGTEQRALAEDHRETYRRGQEADRSTRTAITARRADASISQGAARIGLSAAAGARAERSAARADAKAGSGGDGYEYRTVNGKIQRRKIK